MSERMIIKMKKPSLAVKKFNELIIASSMTMVVSFLMLLIDTIIAGNILGENAISAVNIVMPVYAFANFIAGIIGLGTAYAYSEALGRYDKNQADNLFHRKRSSLHSLSRILSTR